jgi:hypothetical protein
MNQLSMDMLLALYRPQFSSIPALEIHYPIIRVLIHFQQSHIL